MIEKTKNLKRYNGRKLTEDYAIGSLSRKGVTFLKMDGTGSAIIILEGAKNLGNKSFGLIDFLTNHRNFILNNDYSVLLRKKNNS